MSSVETRDEAERQSILKALNQILKGHGGLCHISSLKRGKKLYSSIRTSRKAIGNAKAKGQTLMKLTSSDSTFVLRCVRIAQSRWSTSYVDFYAN